MEREKINKLGKRAAALVLAVGLTLSTAAPVLAADADEVQTPAAQTEQQETDTEADEADVDTEADEAAALPELSEDREVAEEDEAVALPELSEDREVAEGDEAAADGDVDTCGVFHTCTFDELIEQKILPVRKEDIKSISARMLRILDLKSKMHGNQDS